MIPPIAQMYGSRAAAASVENALIEHGFGAHGIHVIDAPPAAEGMTMEHTGTHDDTILNAILKQGVPAEAARIYAEAIHRGHVLVLVHARFGRGQIANSVMHGFHPIAVAVPEIQYPSPFSGDAAAPLSSAMGWRVLSPDPTPLSTWLKWPTIKAEPKTSATLERIRKQSKDPAPLSGKLGMPLLADDPAPLSSKAGIKLLADEPAPLSAKFKWRVLLEQATPLSTKIGFRTLSNDPTPLSGKFGLRLLTDNPAPLSSLLKLKVLTKG